MQILHKPLALCQVTNLNSEVGTQSVSAKPLGDLILEVFQVLLEVYRQPAHIDSISNDMCECSKHF